MFWKTLKFSFSKVCLHLPDYSSSSVASVLSLLYYGDHKLRLNLRLLTEITGETWLSIGDSHSRSNINSLLSSLGVALEVWQGPFGPALRGVPPRNTLSGFTNQCHKKCYIFFHQDFHTDQELKPRKCPPHKPQVLSQTTELCNPAYQQPSIL